MSWQLNVKMKKSGISYLKSCYSVSTSYGHACSCRNQNLLITSSRLTDYQDVIEYAPQPNNKNEE